MKADSPFKPEADILREARSVAAEQRTSGSSLPADGLEHTVFERPRERQGYDQARARAIARLRRGLKLKWVPPLSRDELHQR